MIAVEKIDCPKILSDNATKWAEEIVGKLKRGVPLSTTDKRRYSHKDIKCALLEET